VAKVSKTWWGQRFIQALEGFTDSGRLARGRAYVRNGKIEEYVIDRGRITAFVRGSINPYFGVYTEPMYRTTVEIPQFSQKQWSKAIDILGAKAGTIAKLLLGEIPENIEDAFSDLQLNLLPSNKKEFSTSCSCPDSWNTCKHIAGVCYSIAAELDSDPFLLFELRGLSRAKLKQELLRTPLGRIFSDALDSEDVSIEPSESYYTRPQKLAPGELTSLKDFWHGEKRLPQDIEPALPAMIPAIVVKKGGDFPPFWDRDTSFVEVMEELYQRVRKRKGVF